MNRTELEAIFDNEDYEVFDINDKKCSTMSGLLIIIQYLPNAGIAAADHDIVYSVGIDELLEAGLTEVDAIKLKKLNWMIHDYDSFASFV